MHLCVAELRLQLLRTTETSELRERDAARARRLAVAREEGLETELQSAKVALLACKQRAETAEAQVT
jgi:hypothetical protein